MKKTTKWKIYEYRWKFRDFYFDKILRRHVFEKYFKTVPVMYLYAKKIVMGKEKTNNVLYNAIMGTEPFMVCRFGNTEISLMVSVLKKRLLGETKGEKENFEKWFHRLCELSGFFPENYELSEKFTDVMLNSLGEIDVLAMWHRKMEDYLISEYFPKVKLTYLDFLEPWRSKRPWTSALKGKKVLVIHPFEKSIQEQYKKRKYLFPGTDVLPEFELKTLKAVQTIAGERDERFSDWFEALDYMYQEAMKIDFEVAIIGCGAYGLPLAAKLKKAGKKAIHLGGITQLVFGIKGRRWVESPLTKVKFNEYWVYPKEEETPMNAKNVEIGCYWECHTKE